MPHTIFHDEDFPNYKTVLINLNQIKRLKYTIRLR